MGGPPGERRRPARRALQREAALREALDWLDLWRARALPPGTPPHDWTGWAPPRDADLCARWTAWCEAAVRALGGEVPPPPAPMLMPSAATVRVLVAGSDAAAGRRSRGLALESARALRAQPRRSWTRRVLALLDDAP